MLLDAYLNVIGGEIGQEKHDIKWDENSDENVNRPQSHELHCSTFYSFDNSSELPKEEVWSREVWRLWGWQM